jgi:hypothetical protein
MPERLTGANFADSRSPERGTEDEDAAGENDVLDVEEYEDGEQSAIHSQTDTQRTLLSWLASIWARLFSWWPGSSVVRPPAV